MAESASPDSRYSGDISAALYALLGDTRARVTGSPQWPRDDDSELYDAILMIRDWIVTENERSCPDELPFNIGNSYQRQIASLLSSKRNHAMFIRSQAGNAPELVAAIDVLDKRVAKEVEGYGVCPLPIYRWPGCMPCWKPGCWRKLRAERSCARSARYGATSRWRRRLRAFPGF